MANEVLGLLARAYPESVSRSDTKTLGVKASVVPPMPYDSLHEQELPPHLATAEQESGS